MIPDSSASPAPPSRPRWILRLGLPLIALWAAAWVYDLRPLLPPARADESSAAPVASAAPFALVELFTSEGCSSCPPAEALLNEVARDARAQGQPVLCLAWHVDYWDGLGWKDPFASPAHTQRQRDYARALSAESLYTPQMVVNGREEFVGSRRASARREIAAALARRPRGAISVEVLRAAEGEVRLRYTSSAPPARARLVACLTERGLRSAVERGENAGLSLRHDAVVRSFRDLPLRETRGDLSLPLPRGVALERAEVVVFVQAGRGGEVLAASRAPLRPSR